MPSGIYKRKSPVQEKLARMKDIVLKDARSREKSVTELAKIYGVNHLSLLKFYKENGIKKKRKFVECPNGYIKGGFISKIKDLRIYIKENNITKEQIVDVILNMFK